MGKNKKRIKYRPYKVPFKKFVETMQRKGIREIIGKCQDCGTAENLTVHYEGEIIAKVLCRKCHDKVHNMNHSFL